MQKIEGKKCHFLHKCINPNKAIKKSLLLKINRILGLCREQMESSKLTELQKGKVYLVKMKNKSIKWELWDNKEEWLEKLNKQKSPIA